MRRGEKVKDTSILPISYDTLSLSLYPLSSPSPPLSLLSTLLFHSRELLTHEYLEGALAQDERERRGHGQREVREREASTPHRAHQVLAERVLRDGLVGKALVGRG